MLHRLIPVARENAKQMTAAQGDAVHCLSGIERIQMTREYIHGGDIYRHPGVIDFSVNMNPLGPPDGVKEAVRRSAELISRYPDDRSEELTALLAEREGLQKSDIICGNGAAELIFLWAEAVKPRRAVLAAPYFAEYERALKAAGCDRIIIHMRREEEGFRMTDSIFDDLTEDTDALILCNPDNPTGLLIGQHLMADIIRRCRQYGIHLLVDECFLALCDHGIDHSVKKYLVSEPEIFLLNAFTKTYAMAGLRLGYGITCDQVLSGRMRALTQPWNVSAPAQMAGAAALRTDPSYLEKSLEVIRRERSYLTEGLRRPGFRVYEGKANYILFRVSDEEGQGEAQGDSFGSRLLRRGFLIRDCSSYAGLCRGYYRTAVRTHEDNADFLEAVRAVLN